jgi:type I restriction enzyme, S subunit
MSVLPNGWSAAKLEDLGDWSSGGTPSRKDPENFGGRIPWVKTGDLHHQLIEGVEETITDQGLANSAAKIFPRGTLLVAMYGATIGQTGVLNLDAATNQACAALLANGLTAEIIPYVWRYIISVQNDLKAIGQGGAQPNISQTILKECPITIAPLPEQRRIVAKIDSLSAKSKRARDNLDHVPRLVEKYKQAVLAAAFRGDLTRQAGTRSDRAWDEVSVDNLFEWSSGKNLPSKQQIVGNIPVIGGNGVSGYHNTALIDFPTLVIGRVGAQCGNVHRSDGPAWITDNAIYAKSISSSIDLDFAALFFRASNLNSLAGGTGQPYVNQTTLNGLTMPVPAVEEQREIVRRTNLAFAWIDRLASEATSARKLIEHLDQAVFAKAFRGELVPQDPNDEPASVLLDRIRAGRAATTSVARPTPRKASKKIAKRGK